MADDFRPTQYGSNNQAIGFAGANSGMQNDARFAEVRNAQLRDAFAKSIGMSGIAGAGKFSAFMKTPQGQQAFAAFQQKMSAPKPAPSPTPTPAAKMAPPPGAPNPPLTSMGGQ